MGVGWRVLTVLTMGVTIAACGSGATSSVPSVSPSPVSAAQPSPSKVASASASQSAGPEATTFGSVTASVVRLGPESAPIDVAFAFGSIWTANHHDNTVSRIDPAAQTEIARIQVGSGPGWFVANDDALWVTNQNGRGMSRIDPMTNTAEIRAGLWAPCGAPILAFGSIWVAACEAGVIMKIDADAHTAVDIDAGERTDLAWATDMLVAVGPKGMARLDPKTGTFKEIGAVRGHVIGADDQTIWMTDGVTVRRVDPKTAKVVAELPIQTATLVRPATDRAWLLQEGGAVLEVDQQSGDVRRTIELDEATTGLEAAGALWVTGFDHDSLIRIPLT